MVYLFCIIGALCAPKKMKEVFYYEENIGTDSCSADGGTHAGIPHGG
jgi:hypothetical protein